MRKSRVWATPASAPANYSATLLPKKLGIKPQSVVVLVRAPDRFEATLGKLPAGVVLRRRNQGARDLTVWFTRSRKDLKTGIRRMAQTAEAGRLWILWPKRTSPLAGDHVESDVRRFGLACGLVDYKICVVDHDWSGLLFAARTKRSRR